MKNLQIELRLSEVRRRTEELMMAENKSTLDDRNKYTNEGANDERIASLNEEQHDIATKGGKATPAPKRDVPSQPRSEDDQPSDGNGAHSDRRRQNGDDEINARGGIMVGASKRGARGNVQ
jgi:hypothetical protein